MLQIRQATKADNGVIWKMIIDERLDPSSINWKHFLVAIEDEQIVGIGQVKTYPGCNELGSLIVSESHRNKGVGGKLIAALEDHIPERPMYLLCIAKMEPYYIRYGYKTISWWDAPIFLKIKLLPTMPFHLIGAHVLVMKKD